MVTLILTEVIKCLFICELSQFLIPFFLNHICKVFTYSVTLYPASFHFSNSLAIIICVKRNSSPGSTEGALLICGLFVSFV